MRAARTRESELERAIIDKRQTRRPEALLKAYISGNVENEIQAKTVVDAIYWSRETGGKYFVARGTDLVYKERDEINNSIRAKFTKNDELTIYSPNTIVELVDF